MMLFDCSRVPSPRSGLGRFAVQVERCLDRKIPNHRTLAPASLFPDKTGIVPLPSWVASSSKVSMFKPLLWSAFARFSFPADADTPVLSALQNVLPKAGNQVVTIHDLRPAWMPDNRLQGIYWNKVLPKALRRVRGILTVSETSKRKICQLYCVPEEKVRVIHNAFEQPRAEHAARTRGDRLLSVGGNWPHKNLHELLERHATWSSRFHLDIVMAQTPYFERLSGLVRETGIGSRVRFLHNVEDSDLECLYRSCAALVYPSLDEGFGIPPLEAMALGAPVIASDIEVFREIFDDAPIYVQLGDGASWDAAFQLLESPEPSCNHVSRGLVVAKAYPIQRMELELSTALKTFWPNLPIKGKDQDD